MGQSGKGMKIHAAASRKYVHMIVKQYQFFCTDLMSNATSKDMAFEAFVETKMRVDIEAAQCSSPEDEKMIRERIVAAGGYNQLDNIIQKKQKELIGALIIPAFHLYFSVQPPLYCAPSEDHSARVKQIEDRFKNSSSNAVVCVSNVDWKKTAHQLNMHGALCMVLCAPGRNLLQDPRTSQHTSTLLQF